jgi:hypothetical protein
LPPGRDRLWMPSLSGKGATHEYNRNAGSCRFQGYGCLWVGGDEYIGAESDQLGSESWQAILGLGVTILDDQVSPINPAMVSQAVEPRFLKGGLRLIYSEKAKPTACALRPRTRWRNEQRRRSRNEFPPSHCMTSSSRTSSEAAHISGVASVCLPLCGPRAKRRPWSPFAADESLGYPLGGVPPHCRPTLTGLLSFIRSCSID